MKLKFKKQAPDLSDRYIKKFLWFPAWATYKDHLEIRWLETALIKQCFDALGGNVWDNNSFLDSLPDNVELNTIYE